MEMFPSGQHVPATHQALSHLPVSSEMTKTGKTDTCLVQAQADKCPLRPLL